MSLGIRRMLGAATMIVGVVAASFTVGVGSASAVSCPQGYPNIVTAYLPKPGTYVYGNGSVSVTATFNKVDDGPISLQSWSATHYIDAVFVFAQHDVYELPGGTSGGFYAAANGRSIQRVMWCYGDSPTTTTTTAPTTTTTAAATTSTTRPSTTSTTAPSATTSSTTTVPEESTTTTDAAQAPTTTRPTTASSTTTTIAEEVTAQAEPTTTTTAGPATGDEAVALEEPSRLLPAPSELFDDVDDDEVTLVVAGFVIAGLLSVVGAVKALMAARGR